MLNNLTGLRFFVSLWVFIFHLSTDYITELKMPFIEKGYLGVDFFFILSGFILTYSYSKLFTGVVSWHDYKVFIIKRLAKIYPLHLFTFIIIAGLLVVGKTLMGQDNLVLDWPAVLPNLFLLHGLNFTDKLSWNFPSWSISSEWFAYVILFWAGCLIYRYKKNLFYLNVILIVAFTIYINLNTTAFSQDNYTTISFRRIIPEFMLGMLLGITRLSYTFNKLTASLLFLCGIISLFVFLKENVLDVFCLISFGVIILALSFRTYIDLLFSGKAIVFLGEISFSFYMFQFLAFIVFEILLSNIFILESINWINKIMLVFFINLSFSIFGYYLIEEYCRKLIIRKFIK